MEAEGRLVPETLEGQLRTMRMPSGERIPMASIAPPTQPDPMVGNDLVVGRTAYWYKVVRKMIAKAAPKKKKTKQYVKQSAQELADEKRHRALFEGGIEVNINTKEDK